MIYGVYIWRDRVFLNHTLEPKSENPMQAILLEAEVSDQLLDLQSFQNIFNLIIELKNVKKTDEFIIVCPDSYGIWERTIIYHNAELTGINILRLISVSSAVSMSVPPTDGYDDEEFVVVLQSEGENGLSTVCDISNGICGEYCRFNAFNNGKLSSKWLSKQNGYISYDNISNIVAMDSDDIVDRMIQELISHEVACGHRIPTILLGSYKNVLIGLFVYCRFLAGKGAGRILVPLLTNKLYIENDEIQLLLREQFLVPCNIEKDFLLENISFREDTYFLLKEKNFTGGIHQIAGITIKKEVLKALYDSNSSLDEKRMYLRVHVTIQFDTYGRIETFAFDFKNEDNGKTATINAFDDIQYFAIQEGPDLVQKYETNSSLDFLMDIIDNLDRSIQTIPSTMETHRIGLTQIKTDILTYLRKNNIQEIDALGQPFDAQWHNAVGTEGTGCQLPGVVTKVVHTGFYNTKTGVVVRYASVIVEK